MAKLGTLWEAQRTRLLAWKGQHGADTSRCLLT